MNNLGFLYAFGSAIAWGIIYIINQRMLIHNSPLAVMFIQALITTAIMLPFYIIFLAFNGESPVQILALNKINIFYFLLNSFLIASAAFLIYSSIKLIGAPMATIIEIAYPFFIVIFSFILFKSTVNVYFLLGSLLIFIGSAIIIKFS